MGKSAGGGQSVVSTVVVSTVIITIAVVCSVALYNYAVEEGRKRTRRRLVSRLDNADALAQGGMHEDALAIYAEVAAAVAETGRRADFSDVYALCKRGEGRCYQKKAASEPEAAGNAIRSYEEFLRCLPAAGAGMEEELKRAEVSYHLGLLYVASLEQFPPKDRTACLKRAEGLLVSALSFVDLIAEQLGSPTAPQGRASDASLVRASLHQALGAVYLQRAEREPRRSAEKLLAQAIEALDQALRRYTRDLYPAEYTRLMKQKALSFKKLFALSGDRALMISAAAALAELAAHLDTSDPAGALGETLKELAETQMDLARSLEDTPGREQSKVQRREAVSSAAACYERLLRLSAEESVPLFSADLSLLYQKLAGAKVTLFQLDPSDGLLEEAIALTGKALSHTGEGSLEAATIHSTAGDLYLQLSRRRNGKDNTLKAKAAYAAALKVFDSLGMVSYRQNVERALKNIEGW